MKHYKNLDHVYENLYVYIDYFDGMVRSDGEQYLQHHVLTQKEFDEATNQGDWSWDGYHIDEYLTKQQANELEAAATKINIGAGL